jgi:endogenous inhibitor of DNA gyrase (YacG/DUF329 family)
MGQGVSASRCPTCKKSVKGRPENSAFPFCSFRCQQVDLGRWLNEEFRVPAEEADDDAGSGASGGNES